MKHIKFPLYTYTFRGYTFLHITQYISLKGHKRLITKHTSEINEVLISFLKYYSRPYKCSIKNVNLKTMTSVYTLLLEGSKKSLQKKIKK